MNITTLVILAALVEGFTEYVFGFADRVKPYLKYIALVLGVGATLAYNIDILRDLAGLTSPIPYVGQIISGLIIGRGSNYLNDFVSAIRGE